MTPSPAIVLVTSSFPIRGDGSEAAGAFVADLVNELARHVALRVVAPGDENAIQSWARGVEIFRYRAPSKPLSTLQPWRPADSLDIARVMVSGARATEHAVAAGATGHILALWALPCGEWARHSARRRSLEYSVWTLGSDIWSLGRIPMVRSRLATILSEAKYCWSDGLKLMEDTKAVAGRDVTFLPSTRRIMGGRSEPIRSRPPYRFLFLGRWHPNKGVDLLLEALRTLCTGDWDAIEQIVIAGGGPLEDHVHTVVRSLQAAGRSVTLRGYLTRDEAEEAMLASDYLLIPSRVESIPVVFSDAMKLSLPVVATPVGDFPDLLSQVACGILAPAADLGGVRYALREAIHTPPSYYAKGTAEMAERFDISAVATTILAQIR